MPFAVGQSVIDETIDCNGTLCPITTTQNPGESSDDFHARHNQAVADKRAECADFSAGPATYFTPWACNGNPGATTTTQATGQSMADFYAAHLAAVDAERQRCP